MADRFGGVDEVGVEGGCEEVGLGFGVEVLEERGGSGEGEVGFAGEMLESWDWEWRGGELGGVVVEDCPDDLGVGWYG